MGKSLKYIAVSVAFHAAAAAAILGAGMFPGAAPAPDYVEVTRLYTPAPVDSGVEGHSMMQPEGAEPRPSAASCQDGHIIRDIAQAEEAARIARVKDNGPLRYVTPSVAAAMPDGNVAGADGFGSRPGTCMNGDGPAGGSGPVLCGFGEESGPGILSMASPEYPRRALTMKRGGTVVLLLHIDENGGLSGVSVAEPAGFGLDEAAIESVRGWRFSPATDGERPVPCLAKLAVRFDPPGRVR